MSSAYFEGKIAKCDEVINKISNLYGSIDGIKNQVTSCQEILSNNKLSGSSIGVNEINNIFATLESVRLALNTVVAACIVKKEDFTRLRDEAFARETAELAKENI